MEGKVTLGDISEEPPAIARGTTCCSSAWKGEADDNLDLRVSRDGSFGPVGPWIFADRSNLGFYLAAFRTPPTHPDQLVEPLDSLGFVYIVEKQDMDARGMSFEDFREFVFPGTPIFRRSSNMAATMCSRRQTAARSPSGSNSSSRNTRPGSSTCRSRSTTSGRCRWSPANSCAAPGGHDGLIEIRHPGCEAAPMMLDFRDAPTDPRRKPRWMPGPWIERMFAGFDASRRFVSVGRFCDVRGARTEAAGIYDEMLRAIPTSSGLSSRRR